MPKKVFLAVVFCCLLSEAVGPLFAFQTESGNATIIYYPSAQPDPGRFNSSSLFTSSTTRSRFVRRETRFINFAIAFVIYTKAFPADINQRQFLNYVIFLEEPAGVVCAKISGRGKLWGKGAVRTTDVCNESWGFTEPGRWKVGFYKLKIFVEDQKLSEMKFEIAENEIDTSFLGEWADYMCFSPDLVPIGEGEVGVWYYLDRNNIRYSGQSVQTENGQWGSANALTFWVYEVRDNPGPNEAAETIRLIKVTSDPDTIWPQARFLFNAKSEFLRREKEADKRQPVGSSGLWRRIYDTALRYRN
jgi:hypothetical protein